MNIEKTILSNLLHNEEFTRKVIPFIKPEYFSNREESIVCQTIVDFFNTHNGRPSRDIVAIELSKGRISDQELPQLAAYLKELNFKTENLDWLYKETETFCKKRAIYNSILDSFDIIEGKDTTKTEDAIPDMLSNALSVSFDTNIGHDFLENYESRYDFYHRLEDKLAFDLDIFNKITKGGLSKKTLNVALASTGVGKSLFMCHVAAAALMQSKNVLYITLEMAEERIAERIDANLLDMTMDELSKVDYDIYETRIGKLVKRTAGKLIIKEYPTAAAHSGHFKSLIEELKLKRKFQPDLIIVDYLNICSSARVRTGSGANSYTIVKSIAEELRGLAQYYNVPILTATQTTRDGMNSSDIDLTNTSESIGLPQTADLMFALISTEELENLNQIMVKQLKNRYNDPGYYRRFVIGIDRSRMKLYDVEPSAQANISDSGQDDDISVFDKSGFGSRMKQAGMDDFNF